LLTRNIDLAPFDPPIGEKIFRSAKRVCVVVAVAAMALSALDLMNIRSVTNAAEFFLSDRQRLADLLDLVRSGIQGIAQASSPSAVALIPRGEIAMRPRLTRSAAADAGVIGDASPLAAAPQPVILASADPDSLPVSPITATPVSLPMSAAIPPDTMPTLRPAPAAPPSPAELLHLKGDAYAKAERCLADAVYFEARGEPVSGQIAVAQVVMNRAFSGYYPNDVCAVVYQNANRHRACQFSFACSGKRKTINERGAWARANRIAKLTLDGKLYVAAVGTSTHFHDVSVHPNWVREMRKIVRYGIHDFYRPIAWGNGADEPVWATAALAQSGKR
jgi:hypothetical protein